ncbi:MAG: aminotransferase class V-fold PLP-dependent enzyme [Steroidobacteraceae bacterium]
MSGAPSVYLDHAATTPVDPCVAEEICAVLRDPELAANPASRHLPGRRARALVERARGEVAALVNAPPGDLVFTSGATESINLAVLGAARGNRDRGSHIVTSRTEHRAVLDACRRLGREGFRIGWIRPGADGIVTPAQVEQALEPDTVLVSLMHVNNETGVIQDVGAVARLCRARGILLHIDAAQSAGRIPLDVVALDADLVSFSAHKMYGPKGIGALYVRRDPRPTLVPLVFGGGHEGGLRSGTPATHQIAGFGVAARIAVRGLEADMARIAALRDRLEARLVAAGSAQVNGARTPRAPGLLNLRFDDVEGESLLLLLEGAVVASSGAACSSATGEPSYVLRALGLSDLQAQASLRLSLGRGTTADEVDRAAETILAAVRRLRSLLPDRAETPPEPDRPRDLVRTLRESGLFPEYSAAVLERFGAPVVRLPPDGSGLHLRARAGDRARSAAEVQFDVRVREGVVTATAFGAFGCPHTLAAASLAADRMVGEPLARACRVDARRLSRELAVPEEKLGRLLVVEDAARALESCGVMPINSGVEQAR